LLKIQKNKAMKKIFLLLGALFAFYAIVSAQITQVASDSIVLERMNTEAREHTIYAKENLQMENMNITTSNGELLELNYSCWVYYIHYTEVGENNANRYFIVNERNGNLLEVNTENDAELNNLTQWRIVFQCQFNNPLTDLPWLKEIINEFEEKAETMGYNSHARIYQCNYRDGIGFLLEMCEECPYVLRNCEGSILCDSSKNTEANTCSEFNIDFENKELIWEKSATLCNCIMDTLQGEWKLFRAHEGMPSWSANYPTSNIVLKILSQNDDASINYEFWIEDSLVYKKRFQYEYDQHIFEQDYLIIANMKLLYLRGKPDSEHLFEDFREEAGIYFGYIDYTGNRQDKGILTVWMSSVIDGPINNYEKIK
jgi:hypothetical protein